MTSYFVEVRRRIGVVSRVERKKCGVEYGRKLGFIYGFEGSNKRILTFKRQHYVGTSFVVMVGFVFAPDAEREDKIHTWCAIVPQSQLSVALLMSFRVEFIWGFG